VAEIVALAGYDFVIVDVEHTPMSLETLDDVTRAIEGRGVPVVVRVPWNDPVELKRVLDIGIAGVMIPMVETAEAAEDAVEAMTYPPDGMQTTRSSPSCRSRRFVASRTPATSRRSRASTRCSSGRPTSRPRSA
jgi:2-keto-3-deoxy-L-rhamnonate aldolase RhmA